MGLFLDLLKDDLSHEAFPLIQQAEGYRVRPTKNDIRKTAEAVLDSETKKYEENLPKTLSSIGNDKSPTINEKLTTTDEKSLREFTIEFNDEIWTICIELSYDQSIRDWIEVGRHLIENSSEKKTQIGIRLSLIHPFSRKFAGVDKSRIEPLLRIAAAIGLAEELARGSGVKKAGTVRMNFNKILSQALTNI